MTASYRPASEMVGNFLKHEELLHYIRVLGAITNTMDESVYVVDLYKKQFLYVSLNSQFQCGYTSSEVLSLGYQYYFKIVYKEDLPLLMRMYKEVLSYLKNANDLLRLKYLMFTYRVVLHNEEVLMVNHKVVPLLHEKGQDVRLVVCKVSHSIRKESGNLMALYDEPHRLYSYSFEQEQWCDEHIIMLTDREKGILKLAKQGKSTKEMAAMLHSRENTIRNQKSALYYKLHVNSMSDAIFAASHYSIG
jgi:DNA-binding CsgD family transcriptional regulator